MKASVIQKTGLCCLLVALGLVLLMASAQAAAVTVCFWSESGLKAVQREAGPGAGGVAAALRALVLGPTEAEQAAGLRSAIPPGTVIWSLGIDDNTVAIDLSREIVGSGFGDAKLMDLFDQVRWTVWMNGSAREVIITSGGALLSSFLPPTPKITPRKDVADRKIASAGTALSGRKITASAGHGKVWTGGAYGFQRGITCASTGLAREDDHNLEMIQYLEEYLLSDGATVKVPRCTNKNYGTYSPAGEPWWRMASVYWTWHTGYPCSVYGSTTDCTPGSGADEWNDDVRARPLSSDYDASDIYFGLHTNALSGDCTGSGCPTGSDIFYDCSTEHAAWCNVSRTLQQNVYPALLDAIRNKMPEPNWNDHGIHEDTTGSYGEIRIPDRAAVLLELGYHDTCDYDALLLADNFFRSTAMWGIYKGICDYFSVTPTWAYYSDELVTHNIPSTMTPGQIANVQITFKNRGVLWNSARGFKMSAVGGSDPFTSTLDYAIASETGPGANYTFNLTLTAPTTTGSYVTDWRMQRTGYQWFGATCSQTITVSGTADTTPPSVPTNLAATAPSQTEVNLTWTASTDDRGVAGYKVFRGGAYIGSTTSTSYGDYGLSANTSYSYQVSAYDTSNNESAKCAAVYVTTPPYITIIVDEEAGTWSSGWTTATGVGTAAYNGDYKYAGTAYSETAWYKWSPNLTRAGNWDVYVMYRSGTNRSIKAPYTLSYNGGSQTYQVDQTANGGTWVYLGTKPFNSGTAGYARLTNYTSESSKVVIADAVKFYFRSDTQPSGPTITQQPSAASVCAGATASFTVAASGSGTLTYQWQKNQVNLSNGGHYSGVTTTILTVSSCDANDAANYRCVVTDANGSTNSVEAALTLKTATSITAHPSNQTVDAGSTASFTVAAAGSGTLAYQWQKNSVNLSNGGHYSGVTTATLTISNCDSSDAATYRCIVTGDCGSATSNGATLTVNAGGPVNRIVDNFDSYADTNAFKAVWPIDTSPGLSLSTTQAHSSPKSVYASTAAMRNRRDFTACYGTDASPITWKYWIYDTNTTNLDRQWCELHNYLPSLAQLIVIGKHNSLEAFRTYYAARIAYSPGAGWFALNGTGAPTRSIGWHEIKAVIKGTTIDFYVDGTLAKSGMAYGTSVGQHTFERAKIGSGYTSTSAAYYDDFSITGGL